MMTTQQLIAIILGLVLLLSGLIFMGMRSANADESLSVRTQGVSIAEPSSEDANNRTLENLVR